LPLSVHPGDYRCVSLDRPTAGGRERRKGREGHQSPWRPSRARHRTADGNNQDALVNNPKATDAVLKELASLKYLKFLMLAAQGSPLR
jgi:hypothetical protein